MSTSQASQGSRSGVLFSYDNQTPTTVEWKDLSWSITKPSEKQILSKQNGVVRPGHMLAILGPSGSGKSSLLNILAGRILATEGEVLLNGHPLDKKIRRRIAYVMQDDVLFPNLTVRETLKYAALLRMPRCFSRKEKLQQVERVIDQLGLQKAADTIIGNSLKRGISGGERKRVSVAVELLANPPVLMLDEITSGLDSSTAASIITLLRQLASREQRTIITTIHQPGSQIYKQFDEILLISEGRTAFWGDARLAVSYFARAGLPCSEHFNPADHFLDVLSNPDQCKQLFNYHTKEPFPGPRGGQHDDADKQSPELSHSTDGESESREMSAASSGEDVPTSVPMEHSGVDTPAVVIDVDAIVRHSLPARPSSATSKPSLDASVSRSSRRYRRGTAVWDAMHTRRWPTTFFEQVVILTQRAFKQSRGEIFTAVNWFQSFFIASVVGLAWFQTETKESYINDRMGILFFSVVYWGFQSMFLATQTFPAERAVVMRERSSGAYRLSAYVIGKSISELPLIMAQPTIYLIIAYNMAGLAGKQYFVYTLLLLLLVAVTAQSVGLFIGAVIMDSKRAAVASSVIMLTTMLLGGFYVQNLPEWLDWSKYLSFARYAYYTALTIEFRSGISYVCDEEVSGYEICSRNSTTSSSSSSSPPEIPGEAILDKFDVDTRIGLHVMALLIFTFVFRTLAYLAFRFLHSTKAKTQ